MDRSPSTHLPCILIVDDDDVDRRAIQRQVGGQFAFLEADNEAMATSLMRAHQPDCVLLDYYMPGSDSMALLRLCVQYRIPVIVLTGVENERIAAEATVNGAAACLAKTTLSQAALTQALAEAMAGRSEGREHYLKAELYRRIREEPEIFDFLQQGSLDGVWYWDLEAPKHEWMSPRFWEIFGYDPAAQPHLAAAWQDMIHPDDLQTALANFHRHCEDPSHPYDQVVRYQHRNGSTVWVRCRGLAIRDAQGKPIRMLGAHTDITLLKATEAELYREIMERQQAEAALRQAHDELERRVQERTAELAAVNEGLRTEIEARKQAEAGLRENEARLRAIVRTAVDAMITIDEQGRIESCNPASERMFGYRADEMLGRNVAMLMPPRYGDEHDAYLARYLATGDAKIIGIGREVEGKRKNGSIFPLDLSVSEIHVEGRRLFTGIVRDITARKQAEIDLQRYASDLERSNRELDQFAYVASHDLKAPLRAIDHLAQWIAEDTADALPEASRQDLALLRQRVDRMTELLDSLLAYARIGRSASESATIDTPQVARKILSLLDIPETFTIRVDPDLPSFQAPAAAVELVLRNLIGNALKHHDRADGCVSISGRDLGGEIELCVADDGPGIAPAYHDQIFKMFQTLKPRDQVEGSGVGLALVKKTVEHYGGSITVASEENGGAQFVVRWPKRNGIRS